MVPALKFGMLCRNCRYVASRREYALAEQRKEWYYVAEGVQAGPVAEDALEQLVRRGTITSETFVWARGLTEWTRAGDPNAEAAGFPAVWGGSADSRACSVCGRVLPKDEVIELLGATVCAECKPGYVQRLQEGTLLPTGLVYAGFWIRFAAKLIDNLILGVVSVLAFAVAALFFDPENPIMMLAVHFIMIFAQYGIGAAYCTFFVGRYGATPGKLVCRIRIVFEDGTRITYLRAFARFWAEMLSGLTLYVGYIMAAFDSENRTLHDYVCNTRVVRE